MGIRINGMKSWDHYPWIGQLGYKLRQTSTMFKALETAQRSGFCKASVMSLSGLIWLTVHTEKKVLWMCPVQRMLKFSRLIPSKTHIDYISIQIDYPPVTVPRWSIHNPHLTMRIHAFFLPHTTNIYHHLVVKNPQQNSYLMVKSPSWLSRFLMVKKNQMWYFYLH